MFPYPWKKEELAERLKRYGLQQVLFNLPADNPGRNEPGTGEINYLNIFRFLDQLRYEGWIGCEYMPLGRTEEGLEWMKPYR